MSEATVSARPLDERLLDVLRARARRGVTTLHPRNDLPTLLPDSTWPAVRASLRRLVAARRVVSTVRPGGVREFVVVGDTCPLCGSRVR